MLISFSINNTIISLVTLAQEEALFFDARFHQASHSYLSASNMANAFASLPFTYNLSLQFLCVHSGK
jgi:hypothetical protein